MKFLTKYKWPGNVRELKNIIERLCIMVHKDEIDKNDISRHLGAYDYEDIMTKDTSTLKNAREEFEKEYIIKALKENEKNITLTAKELGIERTNLHRKVKQYNININRI
jgi:two-component system nitrogen regulation response regulator NtrX